MPDLERPLRNFELHYAEVYTPERVPVIKAYFKGLDQARKEIVIIFGSIATIILFLCFLIGRY